MFDHDGELSAFPYLFSKLILFNVTIAVVLLLNILLSFLNVPFHVMSICSSTVKILSPHTVLSKYFLMLLLAIGRNVLSEFIFPDMWRSLHAHLSWSCFNPLPWFAHCWANNAIFPSLSFIIFDPFLLNASSCNLNFSVKCTLWMIYFCTREGEVYNIYGSPRWCKSKQILLTCCQTYKSM